MEKYIEVAQHVVNTHPALIIGTALSCLAVSLMVYKAKKDDEEARVTIIPPLSEDDNDAE